MNQRTIDPTANVNRFSSVDAIARLAIRQLSDEQLIELLTRLEREMVKRAAPVEDRLLNERPVDS